MSFTFGLNPWGLVPAIIIAGFLTWWTYKHTVPAPPAGLKRALMSLRFIVLSIILFLIFEPILNLISSVERRPVLAVLIDQSQSLVPDSSENIASANIRGLLDDFSALDDVDIKFYQFSRTTQALSPDSLEFTGTQTDISSALGFAQNDTRQENLKGVILVSDGQYNAGRNPVYVAEKFPVPIHTITVGDTTRRRDIQVYQLESNAIAYAGREVPVNIFIRKEGFDDAQTTIRLFENGNEVARQSFRLPAGTVTTPISLNWTPSAEGLIRLSASITQLDGELTHQNNQKTIAIKVLSRKRQIVVFANAPSPELAGITQLLRTDEDVEIKTYIQKNRTEFYEGQPIDLDKADAIILAGYPGRVASRQVLADITTLAENGMPLLFLLNHSTDLPLLRESLGSVLPVSPKNIRRRWSAASMNVTERGLQHPIFETDDENTTRWAVLPPLQISETRWQVAPDARVLAQISIRNINLDTPLFVAQNRQKKRSVAVLGTGLWRWKNLPPDLNDMAAFWPARFEKILEWLTTKEDDRPVQVSPEKPIFDAGENIFFTGEVYDESLNPVDLATVEVIVTRPDRSELPYNMEATGAGRYRLNTGTLPEGTYEYNATATQNGLNLGEDQGSFAVAAQSIEFQETGANIALMQQVAIRSGGISLLGNNGSSLIDELNSAGELNSTNFEQASSLPLWQNPWILPFLIVLLSAEWFFRKRSGLN